MPDVTPEQVLAQIRFAVNYQKDRFPKTLAEITAAANKLAQSRAFAEFVSEFVEWPAAIEPEKPAPAAEIIDLMAALKAGIAAGDPHGK